jgi:hypothetical protein
MMGAADSFSCHSQQVCVNQDIYWTMFWAMPWLRWSSASETQPLVVERDLIDRQALRTCKSEHPCIIWQVLLDSDPHISKKFSAPHAYSLFILAKVFCWTCTVFRAADGGAVCKCRGICMSLLCPPAGHVVRREAAWATNNSMEPATLTVKYSCQNQATRCHHCQCQAAHSTRMLAFPEISSISSKRKPRHTHVSSN